MIGKKQLRMDEFTTFKEMYLFAEELLKDGVPEIQPTHAEIFDCMRTFLAFAEWRMKVAKPDSSGIK